MRFGVGFLQPSNVRQHVSCEGVAVAMETAGYLENSRTALNAIRLTKVHRYSKR